MGLFYTAPRREILAPDRPTRTIQGVVKWSLFLGDDQGSGYQNRALDRAEMHIPHIFSRIFGIWFPSLMDTTYSLLIYFNWITKRIKSSCDTLADAGGA